MYTAAHIAAGERTQLLESMEWWERRDVSVLKSQGG